VALHPHQLIHNVGRHGHESYFAPGKQMSQVDESGDTIKSAINRIFYCRLVYSTRI
jgi:hypothetical protein